MIVSAAAPSLQKHLVLGYKICNSTTKDLFLKISQFMHNGKQQGMLWGCRVRRAVTMEYRMGAPQKIKTRTTVCPSNATSGYRCKGNEITVSKKYLQPCSLQHQSQQARHRSSVKCLPIDGKEWGLCTHSGLLLSHKKETLFATTQMGLEVNMLNEVRQKKTKPV